MAVNVLIQKQCIVLYTFVLIFCRFCQLSNPPSLLLASCLDCMTAMLPHFPEEVCTRISKLQFLPGLYYYNPSLIECIRAEHINLFVLGTLVVTQERSCGTYPLLKSYLHFLHRLMKVRLGLKICRVNDLEPFLVLC